MDLSSVASQSRSIEARERVWQPRAPVGVHLRPLHVLLSVTLFVGLWTVVARWYPDWILPSPARVAHRFWQAVSDGTLWYHTRVTLSEALLGFALGFAVAVVLGYALAKSPTLERLLSPYIVASQSTPVIALAPLLVLWFGSGLLSKVLVCALVVFFPMLVNTVVGLRSIDAEYRALFAALGASPWQVFTKLEVPAALPVLLGGVRVGITLSVVGAVVGEFIGADRGLGALINIARGLFDTPLMFAALLMLMAIASALYVAVVLLERALIRWQ